MSFTVIQEMPTVEEILQEMPVPAHLKSVKTERDRMISAIFSGEDDRMLCIIGPCSAHNAEAVIEYTTRLAKVQEKVKDKLVLVPRIYTNKPRTTGMGYKGMLHQPDHLDEPDVVKGLAAIRTMHLRSLEETHLTAADEMLYPGNHPYLDDLLSYVAVGARSVENQQHRLTASGLDIPVGMKNPTSGDMKIMLDSIVAARAPHTFVYNGCSVATEGNSRAHAVLRGYVDQFGHHYPNYHYEDLQRLYEMFEKREMAKPSLVVDTNHSNSGKKYYEQPRIALDVMKTRNSNPQMKSMIKGLLIESYLKPGSQDPQGNEFGLSITDPCMGWEESERLLYDIAQEV